MDPFIPGYIAVIMALIELVKWLIGKYSKNGNGHCKFGSDQANQLRDLAVANDKSTLEETMTRLSITLTEISMSQRSNAQIQANIMQTQQMILERLRDLR